MKQNASSDGLKQPVRIIVQEDEARLRALLQGTSKDIEFVRSAHPAEAIKKGEAELRIETTKTGTDYKTLTIFYDAGRKASALAYVKVSGLLKTILNKPKNEIEDSQIISATVRGEKETKTLLTLSVILPVFLIVFAASSTISSVIDMSSGEKERGTIETLISCNISRITIIIGKTLAAAGIGFTAVLSLLFGLMVCSYFYPDITGGISLFAFAGLRNIGLMLLMTLISVTLFSAAGMAIGLFAKSVMEGTILTLPVIVLSSALSSGLIGGDPFSIRLPYFLIPVLNVAFVLRSFIFNHFNPWGIAITFLMDLLYAALFLLISDRLLRKETVICRS